MAGTRRRTVVITTVVICAAALVGAAGSAGATAASKKPSRSYCEAFEEYDLVVRVRGFTRGYEEQFGVNSLASGDRIPAMALIFSPRLQHTTEVMSKKGPKSLKKRWAAVSEGFGDGADLLEKVDALDGHLDVFRALDPARPEIDDLMRLFSGVREAEFLQSVDDFKPSINRITLSAGATDKELEAVVHAGKDCGVLD